jgi:hypothetical protein
LGSVELERGRVLEVAKTRDNERSPRGPDQGLTGCIRRAQQVWSGAAFGSERASA